MGTNSSPRANEVSTEGRGVEASGLDGGGGRFHQEIFFVLLQPALLKT